MIPTASKTFKSLGTVNTIAVFDVDGRDALNEIEAKITELDDQFSIFKTDSDISRLNANAGVWPVSVGLDTIRLLDKAKRLSQLSEGAFSVTSGPLTALWRRKLNKGEIPDLAEIKASRALICDKDITLADKAGMAKLNKT